MNANIAHQPYHHHTVIPSAAEGSAVAFRALFMGSIVTRFQQATAAMNTAGTTTEALCPIHSPFSGE
jgi:hypothetical protein